MKILYTKEILIFNLILFFINTFILIKNKLLIFNFKYVDFYFIIFNSFSYYNISDFLNSKYYVKFSLSTNINNSRKKSIKKKIYLYFIDFLYSRYQKYQIKQIKEILSQKFELILDPKNPDYLIYNVFGCGHLKKEYKDAIKIAYYTENKIPDFNTADYAVSQHHINFLDRYLRIPYLIGLTMQFNNSMFISIRKYSLKHKKKKFCAAVISNKKTYTKFRKDFINLLNKYKKVDMGGKYNNNVGKIKNKILFLRKYKFSIAMENTEGDGYLSEKILDSFLSGTIPIYYGDYMLDEFINPKSYILIRGTKDINKKLEFIKKIDNDDNLYNQILKEKTFTNSNFKETILNQKKDFLMHIFEQDKRFAKRIDNYHWKMK